jgi:hypothetical protein
MTVLEIELVEMKARLARLEAIVTTLTPRPVARRKQTSTRSVVTDRPMTSEEVLAQLKAEGLIRDLTPEERKLASEWDALPEEEKEAVRATLDNLPPGPMVSDIIIENRR